MSFYVGCVDSLEQVVHIDNMLTFIDLTHHYTALQVDTVACGASSVRTNSSCHQALMVQLLPESICNDNEKSVEAGANLRNTKLFNNCISKRFLTAFPLTQVIHTQKNFTYPCN